MNNREAIAKAFLEFNNKHVEILFAEDYFKAGYEAALASQAQQAERKPAKLERRIKRLSERLEAYKEEYYGKEQILTYHAGYSIGYVEGQLRILEDIPPAPEGGDK